MARVFIAPKANRDLKAIRNYIAKDNPSAADKVVKGIIDKAPAYAATPNIGAKAKGQERYYRHGSYNVFYRPKDDGIAIKRIAHGATRDNARQLGLSKGMKKAGLFRQSEAGRPAKRAKQELGLRHNLAEGKKREKERER